MKSSTRLTSAVFQLTPTRTRCDLIIIANDKKEKIASGLLSPFLAHLKTAQDQITKGGYSILLEPGTDDNAVWFTKATVQRFVRFVSTPEILERVYTIETEILQIEQAIALQSSIEPAQSIVDQQGNPPASHEGNKTLASADNEKAIVLYKPGEQSAEVNGSYSVEGNSKVKLLKVLKIRKIVLQKEQAMAFARAVAAGFEIDQIAPLVSFAKCFQAFRLMEAGSKFMGLWKSKHETGQWLDIEASEEMSTRGELSAINSSGIILSTSPIKHEMSNHELASGDVGQSDHGSSVDNPVPNGQQAYYQGHFPHLLVPPWAMHAPPGAQPIFPSYPVHGMPYYQGHTGNIPSFQPPYNPVEHPTPNFRHQAGQERQAPDAMNGNIGAETWELDRALVDIDGEVSHEQKLRKRTGRSGRRKAGMVVIRNINYITPQGKRSGSESISGSEDGTNETSDSDGNQIINQNSKRFSNGNGSMVEISKCGKDSDDGAWQAFQNCLLSGSHEDGHAGMFSMEKNVNIKRHINTANDDPLALGPLSTGEIQDARVKDIQRISESTSRQLRGPDGDASLSRTGNYFRGTSDQLDIEYSEINGRKVLSRKTQEDVMNCGRHNEMNSRSSLDPLAMYSCEVATTGTNNEFALGTPDEAFIVPCRSMNPVGESNVMAIDLESEIPLAHQKLDSQGNAYRIRYEPDDLSMMPERGAEKRSAGYDLAVDYEMQALASREQAKGVKNVTDVKGKSRKSEKATSSKVISGSGRPGGPIRNGRSSKMTPLEDARARAEKLRSYKADLQKLKKEKEEAEAKRLEALKLQRQKRIAAKGNSVKAAASPPQSKQMHSKLSPASNKGSKFSDAEPGSSSPLQRSKLRTPLLSSDQLKASKTSKLSEGSHMARNRLTRSSSSLSETKKEGNGVTPDTKSSMARIRRLSEPKTINSIPLTSVKARSAEAVPKRKLSEGSAKNKISSIIQLDRSKAATLPELKTKASISHVVSSDTKSAVKSAQNLNGMNTSTLCENSVNASTSSSRAIQVDADENTIVEKTVVMLEYGKPSRITSPSLAAVTKSEIRNQQYDGHNQGDKSNAISGLVPTRALRSPRNGAATDPKRNPVQKNMDSTEGWAANSEKDPVHDATAEKSYQAPYARVSSIEDPCTAQSDYFKAPVPRPDLVPEVDETVNVHIAAVKNVKLDEHVAAVERTRVKESSKGLRRLLKFGKKNHSSSVDQSVDSDCSVDATIEQDDNARRISSTSQVHMLKNLISQEESPSAVNAASYKTSRHFSLFSPFRSKTSEKKQAS